MSQYRRLEDPAGPHLEERSRRDRKDSLEAGEPGACPPGGVSHLERVEIGPCHHAVQGQQCLVFAGKGETVAGHSEVEWGVTQPVASQQEPPLRAVPEGDGELAGELREALRPEGIDELEDQAGILGGSDRLPRRVGATSGRCRPDCLWLPRKRPARAPARPRCVGCPECRDAGRAPATIPPPRARDGPACLPAPAARCDPPAPRMPYSAPTGTPACEESYRIGCVGGR